MKKEINNKNKVIPEIRNRESQPCEKTKRLISPTETLGDDGWCDSWDDVVKTLGDNGWRVLGDDVKKNKLSFPKFVIGNLHLMIKKAAEGPDYSTRGRHYIKAFTLIELLVVVLIIGILAAIALPQYQKAVIKSRYTTIKSLVHSIVNAQEIYYLANGHYSDSFSDLDIDTPGGWTAPQGEDGDSNRIFAWGTCSLSTSTVDCDVPTSNGYLEYNIFLSKATGIASGYHGKAACVAGNDDLTSLENQICKAETQLTSPSYTAGGHAIWRYDN